MKIALKLRYKNPDIKGVKKLSLVDIFIPEKLRTDKELFYCVGQMVNQEVPSIFVFLAFGFFWYWMECPILFKMSFAWSATFILCLALFRLGFHRAPRLIHTIVTDVFLACGSPLIGKNSFLWVYLLQGIFWQGNVWTAKEKNLRKLSTGICILMLVLTVVFAATGWIPAEVPAKYDTFVYFQGLWSVFYFSITILLSGLAYKRDAQKYQEQLENKSLMMLQQAKMSTLGEMAGGVAHEINNPLAMILGNMTHLARELKEESFDRAKVQERSEKVLRTVERIAKIVNALRAFSRDADKDPYQKTTVNEIVESTLDLCGENLNNNHVEIKISGDKNLQIDCRSTQISQVLVSLVNNSFDAIKNLPEKWIEIHWEKNQEKISMRVTDSGKGIPDAIVEKIMQPFFTTKELGKGTGLGLSISKGIVESHGGTLQLDRTRANTSFVIELPLHQSAEKRAA